MLIIEWIYREKEFVLQDIQKVKAFNKQFVRIVCYIIFLFIILALRGGAVEFIYFQF